MNFIIIKKLKTIKIEKKCLTSAENQFPNEIGEAGKLGQVRN